MATFFNPLQFWYQINLNMQNFRGFILLISYKSFIFAVNYMQMRNE